MHFYVHVSLYVHAYVHTKKKLLINRYPKFSCKKLSFHHEKVTAGAQEKRKHSCISCYSEVIKERGIHSI